MPTTLCIYVALHCHCSLHIDLTLLYIHVKQVSQYTLWWEVISTCTMHLTAIFILSYQWPLMYASLGRHISFSVCIWITFKIGQTCVPIQNTNTHEVLSDSPKYFTFVSITVASHQWSLKYSLSGSHMCSLQMPMTLLLQFISTSHLVAILHYHNIIALL